MYASLRFNSMEQAMNFITDSNYSYDFKSSRGTLYYKNNINPKIWAAIYNLENTPGGVLYNCEASMILRESRSN